MPRLDGLEAGRIIKKLYPNITMLLYTLTPPSYLQEEAQAVGFQEVFENLTAKR